MKLITGKNCKEYLDEKNAIFLMDFGKSDNTNLPAEIGDILRVASEEVLINSNETNPDYPYFTGYINRALELVPEKSTSEKLDELYRLSLLQPKRPSVEEIEHWQQTFKSAEVKKAKKLLPEEYEKIRKPLQPLPRDYYVDWREGVAWSQWHIRGISIEDKELFDKGEKTFKEIIMGHSLHQDLRLDLGLKKLVQFLITESDMKSYVRMMKGETNPSDGNVQKSKVIYKPSAGEPQDVVKAEEEEMLIDKEGAEIIEKYIISESSYWIPPGEVGSYSTSWAYMGTIWTGNVSEGVQREDLHEEFFYPDENLPNPNSELFDGRFIVRFFNQKPPTYWIWKAKNDPYPLNPYCHVDRGSHWLKPENEVKMVGHEAYPEWKDRREDCQ